MSKALAFSLSGSQLPSIFKHLLYELNMQVPWLVSKEYLLLVERETTTTTT